jgi:hypothetical protein
MLSQRGSTRDGLPYLHPMALQALLGIVLVTVVVFALVWLVGRATLGE